MLWRYFFLSNFGADTGNNGTVCELQHNSLARLILMSYASEQPNDEYIAFLEHLGFTLDSGIKAELTSIYAATDWEDPSTGQDWNNVGVAALIQAQSCDELSFKETLVEMAREAFAAGEPEFPLCKVHGILLEVMLGNFVSAQAQAFNALIQFQLELEKDLSNVPLGLIYFPADQCDRNIDRVGLVEQLFSATDGMQQAYRWLCQVFVQSQQIFYNQFGLRTLAIATQIDLTLPLNRLKYGVACLMSGQIEGLIYLHQAHCLAPTDATVLQSLYLAYKDLGQPEVAHQYWKQAKEIEGKHSQSAATWTQASPDAEFTYLPFDQNILLAVQPNFNSIVTSVVLSEGDWFESEMEFWRNWLKPGMTVIDVGANAGVYTFSAASRVGSEGKVIAIEPFPACVGYLKETCRVNQLDWVKVYGAAASDQSGTVHLSIQGASELNEVVAGDRETLPPGQYVDVPCLTLDSLIEQENLQNVHILKLDAEGHEINVLRGCDRILSEFAPVILYENVAGSQGINLEVANFLIQNNYQLHVYRPYLQQIVTLNSLDDLNGQLNIVATPKT
jgi:FkbM family methyltransferase